MKRRVRVRRSGVCEIEFGFVGLGFRSFENMFEASQIDEIPWGDSRILTKFELTKLTKLTKPWFVNWRHVVQNLDCVLIKLDYMLRQLHF